MSKMSDWAMDLEDATVEALNNGAECEADVIAYVKTKVVVVDEKYVSDLYTEFCGDYSVEHREQLMDLILSILFAIVLYIVFILPFVVFCVALVKSVVK